MRGDGRFSGFARLRFKAVSDSIPFDETMNNSKR